MSISFCCILACMLKSSLKLFKSANSVSLSIALLFFILLFSSCGNEQQSSENLASLEKMETFKFKKALNISGWTIQGDTFNLSDLKGKSVFVSVWASWCKACKSEMPFYHQLFLSNKDTSLVFLSISVDDNKDLWERALDKIKVGGLQVIAKGGSNALFMKEYSFSMIPQYMLIDKKGRIITLNAPMPSSYEIKKALNKLKS